MKMTDEIKTPMTEEEQEAIHKLITATTGGITMLHATNELQGAALDWAVAKCEGLLHDDGTVSDYWQPSELWEQGGPIIEREKLTVAPNDQKAYVGQEAWSAYRIETLFTDQGDREYQTGSTPLIAAMRCYVASKLGDEVEIPEELK